MEIIYPHELMLPISIDLDSYIYLDIAKYLKALYIKQNGELTNLVLGGLEVDQHDKKYVHTDIIDGLDGFSIPDITIRKKVYQPDNSREPTAYFVAFFSESVPENIIQVLASNPLEIFETMQIDFFFSVLEFNEEEHCINVEANEIVNQITLEFMGGLAELKKDCCLICCEESESRKLIPLTVNVGNDISLEFDINKMKITLGGIDIQSGEVISQARETAEQLLINLKFKCSKLLIGNNNNFNSVAYGLKLKSAELKSNGHIELYLFDRVARNQAICEYTGNTINLLNFSENNLLKITDGCGFTVGNKSCDYRNLEIAINSSHTIEGKKEFYVYSSDPNATTVITDPNLRIIGNGLDIGRLILKGTGIIEIYNVKLNGIDTAEYTGKLNIRKLSR